MGSANLPTAIDDGIIPASNHNSLKAAMEGNIVPRNTSGVATADEGDLGEQALPFKKAHITAGYNFCGEIRDFDSYNGLLSIPQGFMACDGSIVNETNYDLVHGLGSWDLYIISSPLDGKYLPNLNGIYIMGSSTTTQDGSIAKTFTGNADHEIDISHTHSVPNHKHNLDPTTGGGQGNIAKDGAAFPGYWAFTNTDGGSTTGTSGSTTENIQPETYQVQKLMRII